VRISMCHCLACQRRTGERVRRPGALPRRHVRDRRPLPTSTSASRTRARSGSSRSAPNAARRSSTGSLRCPGLSPFPVGAFADPEFPGASGVGLGVPAVPLGRGSETWKNISTSERDGGPMSSYAVVHLDDIDEITDGREPWRPGPAPLRDPGLSASTRGRLPTRDDRIINEHDESDGPDPQEELYLVLQGERGSSWTGKRSSADRHPRLRSPGVKRTALAEEPGRPACLGGTPGRPTSPDGRWSLGAAHPLYQLASTRGCRPRRELVEAHPEYGALIYNVACCREPRRSHRDAISTLRLAIDRNEGVRKLAARTPISTGSEGAAFRSSSASRVRTRWSSSRPRHQVTPLESSSTSLFVLFGDHPGHELSSHTSRPGAESSAGCSWLSALWVGVDDVRRG
jgi:hypothetical protein